MISPCGGTVSAAVDGLADMMPPAVDRDNPAGNHVVLVCDGVHIEFAHLPKGSLKVAPGDAVRAGDLIGRVGNSGNTTDPTCMSMPPTREPAMVYRLRSRVDSPSAIVFTSTDPDRH